MRASPSSRRYEKPTRLRARLAPPRRWPMGSAAVAALLLAAAVVLARRRNRRTAPVQAAAVRSAPPPDWVDIARPFQLFDLSAPHLPRSTLTYAARRHRTGGGRQDILTFGKLDGGDAPFFRLMLYRVGTEAAPQAPLFVDLVRLAAAAGLADHPQSAARRHSPTRFGRFRRRPISTSPPGPARRRLAWAFAAPGSRAAFGSAALPAVRGRGRCRGRRSPASSTAWI